MQDLQPEQVLALAEAAGIPILAEDLPAVTHLLNALRKALSALESIPGDVEPLLAPPPPAASP